MKIHKFRHYGPMAQDFYAAFGKDKYGVNRTIPLSTRQTLLA
jgi:hypothetical protein